MQGRTNRLPSTTKTLKKYKNVYLGCKITTDGNSEMDVLHRLSKARGAFAVLRNTWRSSWIGTKIKLKIFKSNVLGVLLYGAESWKVSQSIRHKIDVFQTRCLRRILKTFWPRTISNEELYRRTNTAHCQLRSKGGDGTAAFRFVNGRCHFRDTLKFF